MRFQLCSAVLLCMVLSAQYSPAQAPQGKAPEVTVGEGSSFKPAYRIEPLVNRFSARRGKVIPFEFTLTSQGQSTIEIAPVALLQQETGVILPDEKVPPPPELVITSDSSVVMKKDDAFTIRGTVQVANNNSTFQSYGILVKNVNPKANNLDAGQPNDTALAVSLVTRYLLRCDIEVQGARGGLVPNLVLERAELTDENGLAMVKVLVNNPTADATDFGLKCALRNKQTQAEYPTFGTFMPCRASVETEERFQGKILSGARIIMQAPVPHPLFVADYELIATLTEKDRTSRRFVFDLSVLADDFPAQNRNLVEVVPGVLASPGMAELSLEKGGKRSVTIELGNNRTEEVTLSFAATGVANDPADWLVIRPESVTLGAGQSRRVVLMLGPDRDQEHNHYARLTIHEVNPVNAEGNEEVQAFRQLMVSMIGKDTGSAKLDPGKLAWNTTGRHPAFVLPVANSGTRHIPLFAEMVLSSPDGSTDPIRAGYGRWLLPGESTELRFRMSTLPPPGEYRAEARIYLGEGIEPLSVVETVQLAY